MGALRYDHLARDPNKTWLETVLTMGYTIRHSHPNKSAGPVVGLHFTRTILEGRLMDRPSNRLGYRFRVESPRPVKAMPRKTRTSGRPVLGAAPPVDGSVLGAATALGAAAGAAGATGAGAAAGADGPAVAPGAAVGADGATGAGADVGATGAGAAVAAAGAAPALT